MADVDVADKQAAIDENERRIAELAANAGASDDAPSQSGVQADDDPVVTQETPATSPLDELRAEFAVEAEKPRLFKRFPARKGRLAAEYKPLPLKAAKEAQKKDRDDDILIASVLRMMIHAPEHPNAISEGQPGEGLVPLGQWAGHPELDSLKFDNRLAELLGIPKGTARQIVLALFEGNDLALGVQAGELGTWSGEGYDRELQDFGQGS